MLSLCEILIDLILSVFSIDLIVISVCSLAVLSVFYIIFHLISGKKVMYK